tara:strand:+ start:1783 stop:3291 length:1509 start_codon:yes stop_codon:yes gene_type:complete
MSQLLPLQKYAAVDYNGLVTDNHFHALYQQKPELISNVIKSIYKTNLQGKLREFVDRFPVKEVEQENGFYNWMLQGQHDKNLALVDAETIGGSSISAGTFPANVGANGERFYLLFDEPLFEETNVLRGESDAYHYLVKKVTDAGSRYKVEVELLTDDTDMTVPSDELAVSTRFSKFYGAAPSTLSYRGSEPYFTSPWRMENRPSTLRMQYEVAGNTINKGKNEPLEFGFNYKGQQESMWINYQDLVAHHQCEEMFARMCLYGKKNWGSDHKYLNKDDKTKYAIESGAGFFEQIAPSNVHYYNTYDLDWHLEMLLDMGVGKLERGKRVVHILTGEFGAIEISKQISAKTDAKVQIVSDKWITGKTAPGTIGGSNTYSSLEPQYNIYQYYNGVELRVEILDFFDDDVYFPQRHPDGLGIVESHRMLALDYGEDAGIYRVKPKGVPDYNWAYIAGMRDPFTAGGKGSPKSVSSSIDGYEVHFQKWGGMMIEDPTKVVDLRLNVTK